MGKYSLPKVVDSYSVVEICKMKNLQVRPYALSEFPLEGAHKSFKDELAIVSHFLHNKRLGINVNFASEASLLMQELSAELLARQGMLGEPRMAEPDMFADFFNVPFLPKQGADFTFIDLFAGIGGFRLAMQAVGGKCIFSSEFNEPAQKTYFANYGDMPFGDITLEETKRYIPENFGSGAEVRG